METQSYSPLTVAIAHFLCLLSMSFFAANYVSMAIWNTYFSGFYFNVVRTVATIPLLPLLLGCNSCLIQSSDDLFEIEETSEEKTPRGCPHLPSPDKIIEENWRPSNDMVIFPTAEEHDIDVPSIETFESEARHSTVSDYCSTTPGGSSIISSSAMLFTLSAPNVIAKSSQSLIDPSKIAAEDCESVTKKNRTLSWLHVKLSTCACCTISLPKEKNIFQMFDSVLCCFSSLSHYKLHPKARWPVFFSTISGCVRQMIIPVALMFTTANAAGIIQPAVPVFTAVVAIAYGLEKFCWMTGLAIFFCMMGLFISEEVWNLDHIDIGLVLLLLVPISKGFQVIGTQLAAKYHGSHVLQVYQITGLIVFTFPTACLLELGIVRHWSLTEMITDVAEINVACWFAIWFTVVGILLVAWRIQIFSIKVFGSMGVALYQSFQPIFTFILAYWFLNEPVDIYQITGAVIVCAGLFIYLLRKYWDHQQKKSVKQEEQIATTKSRRHDVDDRLIRVTSTVESSASHFLSRIPTTESTNEFDTESPLIRSREGAFKVPVEAWPEEGQPGRPTSLEGQREFTFHCVSPVLRWASWSEGTSLHKNEIDQNQSAASSVESLSSCSFGISTSEKLETRKIRVRSPTLKDSTELDEMAIVTEKIRELAS